MTWIYCFTDEGYGVIHMIVRLPKGSERLEIEDIRKHWQRLHKAIAVIIKKVHNPKGLSDYLADQRKRSGMAKEMYYQPSIKRWRMSKGWIPKGFAVAFGRYWQRCQAIPDSLREQILREWIMETVEDYEQIHKVPRIDSSGLLHRG
jgi:hypothetical protein